MKIWNWEGSQGLDLAVLVFLVSMVKDQNKQTVETSTVHPSLCVCVCESMESTLWILVVVFYLFWFFLKVVVRMVLVKF